MGAQIKDRSFDYLKIFIPCELDTFTVFHYILYRDIKLNLCQAATGAKGTFKVTNTSERWSVGFKYCFSMRGKNLS